MTPLPVSGFANAGVRSLPDIASHVLSLIWVACGLFLVSNAAPAAPSTDLWHGLGTGEYIALLRHAIAPGTGDPEHFVLGDCATQRNLSGSGRAQAVRIGERLREHGITAARVYTSQWCRAVETAKLLGLGPVVEMTALNSFFRLPRKQEAQMQVLEQWLASQDHARPLVLVTHEVNITALTGVSPASGEMVVVKRAAGGKVQVVGTLRAE